MQQAIYAVRIPFIFHRGSPGADGMNNWPRRDFLPPTHQFPTRLIDYNLLRTHPGAPRRLSYAHFKHAAGSGIIYIQIRTFMKTSIKPILNRITQQHERYTLVLQIIRDRRRAVIFTPYRLLASEFNPIKGVVKPLSRRKADIAHAREVNDYIREQTVELERIVERMEREGKPFTARDVAVSYRQRYDRSFVHIFFAELIGDLEQRGRHGTATSYRSTLSIFRKFANGRQYHFSDLNETVLAEFERFLLLSDLQRNTRSFYMRVMRAVFNKAKRLGLTAAGQAPFDAVSFREDATRKLAVSAETLRKVMRAIPEEAEVGVARDLFLFSFYARGMSFVDIAYLRHDQISDGFIRYQRRKTGQPFVVKIVPQLQQLLDRYEWCDPWAMPVMITGRRPQPVFPIVPFENEGEKEFGKRLHAQYKHALTRFTQYLELFSIQQGLSQKLTFNVARHSWASLARSKGIPVSVISQGLGHSSETTTRIYLAELDSHQVNEANEIIIDLDNDVEP